MMESEAPLENRILRARARGEISADAAFEVLFGEYRRMVAAWLALRVGADAVDDLAQDVWLIFYERFRRWQFGLEMESVDARPVLSFLFRTCQFVARGHRRLSHTRKAAPLPEGSEPVSRADSTVERAVDAARALSLARGLCSEEENDVLLAKLAGFSAREIAQMLALTEPMVDHRYRDALARLRRELKP